MATLPYALYDAFTDRAFGGSPAAIVSDADGLDAETRLRIAREFRFPATCFVINAGNDGITVRFQSVEKEYPMCGHGTICLVTQLIDTGVLDWQNGDRIEVPLHVGPATAPVEATRTKNGRANVMLDIKPARIENHAPDPKRLAALLGISTSDYNETLPIETAYGDFVHLIVPISSLDAMDRIAPDFAGLKAYCLEGGIETVAVFCQEVIQPDYNLHVRDFCPAVGVDESAAVGTTNAALTTYLVHHNVLKTDSDGTVVLQIEQGFEMSRPSSIRSVVTLKAGAIQRLQVGGVATKVLDGQLYIP